MKRVLYYLVVCFLVGCNQVETLENEGDDCLVSFNLVGDIYTSDSPMTKASTDDIYFVQVYQGTNPFALGLFDDINRISFNLKIDNSKHYRIVMSLLKGGKNKLGSEYNSTNNTVHLYMSGYGLNTYFLGSSARYLYYQLNDKYYNSVGGSLGGNTNPQILGITNCRVFEEKYPVCDDWLYGEINDYSPTGEYETLNLELKRVGFKLKYELFGVTDGEVTVKVSNNTRTFIQSTSNTATYSSDPVFFAFYDAYSAWQYADDYMENFTLSVSWLRGIGITEDYGTKTIQLKRNCLNNIKINLGSNDQNAGMNLTVEAENTIGADSVTIPVQ